MFPLENRERRVPRSALRGSNEYGDEAGLSSGETLIELA